MIELKRELSEGMVQCSLRSSQFGEFKKCFAKRNELISSKNIKLKELVKGEGTRRDEKLPAINPTKFFATYHF